MDEPILSPEEARSQILAGSSGPFTVNGRLDLTGSQLESLPKGIRCYELDASRSLLTTLPEDLEVEGRLALDECSSLESLPRGLKVGSLSLQSCPRIEALPEDLDVWFLDMEGCVNFQRWPERARVRNGIVSFRNCMSLRSLPAWLEVVASLDVSGCPLLSEIPDGVEVRTFLDIGGTEVRTLPASLEGAPLRLRGVPVSERVALRPDELTAEEVLAEQNSEVRRVMIERMGYLRFAEEAKAKVLDRDTDPGGERRLLRIKLFDDEPLVGLFCSCPSTGRQYLLRVPPETRSCHQAAAWIAGFKNPSDYNPIIET